MTTKPTERDLIEEVEELLAQYRPAWRAHRVIIDVDLLRRLVAEVKRLRKQVTPKPQPKAGACIGRFAFRSDECTKCGLSREDHE